MIASTLLDAVKQAANDERAASFVLATDGKRVVWLPSLLPGWFPIHAAVEKEESC